MSLYRATAAVLIAMALTANADSTPKVAAAPAVTASQANVPTMLPAVQITMPNFGMVPGETRAIHATMKSGENAVSGKKIKFSVSGAQIGSDNTDASGNATFNWKLPNKPEGSYDVLAKFDGDSTHRGGQTTSKLLVIKGMTETQVEFTTVSNEGGSSPALPIFIFHVIRKSDGQKLATKVDAKLNGAVYHAADGTVPNTESAQVFPSGHGPWKIEAQFNGDAYNQASYGTKTHP